MNKYEWIFVLWAVGFAFGSAVSGFFLHTSKNPRKHLYCLALSSVWFLTVPVFGVAFLVKFCKGVREQ